MPRESKLTQTPHPDRRLSVRLLRSGALLGLLSIGIVMAVFLINVERYSIISRPICRAFGYAAAACLVIPYLYVVRRWRLNRRNINMSTWILWHVYASFIALYFTLVHSHGHAEDVLTFWLMALFWTVIVSGVVGMVGQRLLYRLLRRIVPNELGIQNLEAARLALLQEAETIESSSSYLVPEDLNNWDDFCDALCELEMAEEWQWKFDICSQFWDCLEKTTQETVREAVRSHEILDAKRRQIVNDINRVLEDPTSRFYRTWQFHDVHLDENTRELLDRDVKSMTDEDWTTLNRSIFRTLFGDTLEFSARDEYAAVQVSSVRDWPEFCQRLYRLDEIVVGGRWVLEIRRSLWRAFPERSRELIRAASDANFVRTLDRTRIVHAINVEIHKKKANPFSKTGASLLSAQISNDVELILAANPVLKEPSQRNRVMHDLVETLFPKGLCNLNSGANITTDQIASWEIFSRELSRQPDETTSTWAAMARYDIWQAMDLDDDQRTLIENASQSKAERRGEPVVEPDETTALAVIDAFNRVLEQGPELFLRRHILSWQLSETVKSQLGSKNQYPDSFVHRQIFQSAFSDFLSPCSAERPAAVSEFAKHVKQQLRTSLPNLWMFFFPDRSKLFSDNEFNQMRQILSREQQGPLLALKRLLEERQALNIEWVIHRLARVWLLFHGPAAYALLILVVMHITTSIQFGGW